MHLHIHTYTQTYTHTYIHTIFLVSADSLWFHYFLDVILRSQGTKIEIPVVELTSCVDTSKSSEASKIDNNVEIKKTNKDSMAAIVDENHQTLNSVTESENADVETATLNNKVAESNLVDSICVLDEEFECSETLNVLSSKEVDNDDVSSRREHSTAEVSTHVTTDNLNATVLESVNTSQGNVHKRDLIMESMS